MQAVRVDVHISNVCHCAPLGWNGARQRVPIEIPAHTGSIETRAVKHWWTMSAGAIDYERVATRVMMRVVGQRSSGIGPDSTAPPAHCPRDDISTYISVMLVIVLHSAGTSPVRLLPLRYLQPCDHPAPKNSSSATEDIMPARAGLQMLEKWSAADEIPAGANDYVCADADR